MVKEYKKGTKIPLGAHFSTLDFDCHCSRTNCTVTLIDDNLPPALDLLWARTGAFKLSRGYSCQAHNAEVGGVKDSQHIKGKAADCKSLKDLSGLEMSERAALVPAFANGGIGAYPVFAHVDVRGVKARWSWSYSAC